MKLFSVSKMYKDPQRKGSGNISYGSPLKLMLRELRWCLEDLRILQRLAFLPLIVSNLTGALNLHDWAWKVFESLVNAMVKRFCSLVAAKDLIHAAFVWLFCRETLPDQPVSRKIFLLPCWSLFCVCVRWLEWMIFDWVRRCALASNWWMGRSALKRKSRPTARGRWGIILPINIPQWAAIILHFIRLSDALISSPLCWLLSDCLLQDSSLRPVCHQLPADRQWEGRPTHAAVCSSASLGAQITNCLRHSDKKQIYS